MKRLGLKGFVLMMSILMFGWTTLSAQTDEPGPFERFFHAMRRAFNEPQHKSTQRTRHKRTDKTASAPVEESNAQTSTAPGANAVPSERNTRTATRAATRKKEDLPYGTPVPGKTGLVTSPYSPDGGYIDVRGFAPGTPVKDPYSGKIFLTP